MATTDYKLIEHPGAWRATDFEGKDDLAIDLEPRHVAALEAALASVHDAGIALDDITRESFPLDDIAADIAAWREEVMEGRGIVLLRGFPIDGHSVESIGLMYFGLGAHFGHALSQSVMGDRLGHVVNIGDKDSRERAYRNSRELTPHTDASDLIAMLCLQPATSGGFSGYASIYAIYNELVRHNPDYLEVLFRGFPYHRFGEQEPGEPPVTTHDVPILSWCEGRLSGAYIRAYMEMGLEELGRAMSEHERAALDALDDLSCSDDLLFQTLLEPGEMTIINNYTVMHTRTGFEDDDDPAKKRHLLRLWLSAHEPRPVVQGVRRYDLHKGIAVQAGQTTYYTGETPTVEVPRPTARGAIHVADRGITG